MQAVSMGIHIHAELLHPLQGVVGRPTYTWCSCSNARIEVLQVLLHSQLTSGQRGRCTCELYNISHRASNCGSCCRISVAPDMVVQLEVVYSTSSSR